MKRAYQITGVLFIPFSVFVARESIELRFYTSLGPGPGFFPFWLSVLLGLLACVMLCQATFGRSDPMPADMFPRKVGYLRLAAITVALIGVLVLMNPLGFRLSMLAFLLFLLFALGRANPVVAVPVALAGSFGFYYVFLEWLKIPLPVGMFGI